MLAIDVSQTMLSEAEHRYPSSPIEFRHSDIAHFSSSDVYDVIISNSSFQWLKDYDASLKAMRRCLAPNGGWLFKLLTDKYGALKWLN